MNKFRPSIIHYASIEDCQMVLDELKEDLVNQFEEATYQKLVQILDIKKGEITGRYNR